MPKTLEGYRDCVCVYARVCTCVRVRVCAGGKRAREGGNVKLESGVQNRSEVNKVPLTRGHVFSFSGRSTLELII